MLAWLAKRKPGFRETERTIPMSLTLYLHPLASFCHKVLIGLYENDTPFRAVTVDLGDEAERSELTARWPVGKIPVLHDAARNRTVPESSIILDYLEQHYPGPVCLLPGDAETALDVRLWDRFFDLYVSVPMQKIVVDRLRPEGEGDATGVAEARATLTLAYGMIDRQVRGHDWAVGNAFTMADCAAVPALFFAGIVAPFRAEHDALAAYFERLIERPSVRRVIDDARPWFTHFPYREAMPARFLEG
jgi:glutathione S-transferase